MPRGLLVPPVRRLQGQIRLPMIQNPGAAVARQLGDSMITRDSLRLARTSPTQIAPGPMPSPQAFVMDGPGFVNAPDSMQNGLRIGNAKRLVDSSRGQSAGI